MTVSLDALDDATFKRMNDVDFAVGDVLGALLFGFLRSGSINMEITAHIPSAVVLICQGLIVIIIAGSAILTNRKSNR